MNCRSSFYLDLIILQQHLENSYDHNLAIPSFEVIYRIMRPVLKFSR